MSASLDLATLPNAKLAALFSSATGEKVSRFSDRRNGAARLEAALHSRGLRLEANGAEIEVVKAEPVEIVEAIEESQEAADQPKAVDETILELLAEIGPCKVGAIRKLWQSRDAEFAALRDKQAKGRMRASVRRLEEAGRIRKDGSIFSIAVSTDRPGDAAAIYAAETGSSYERALVACNMD